MKKMLSNGDLVFGRAASGGALTPQPPRVTGVGPEFLRIFNPVFWSIFLTIFVIGRLPRFFPRTILRSNIVVRMKCDLRKSEKKKGKKNPAQK